MFSFPFFDPARPPPSVHATDQSSLDQNFVQHFLSTKLEQKILPKPSSASISELKQKLTDLVGEIDLLKAQKATLKKEISLQPDSNWRVGIEQLEQVQYSIAEKLQQLSDPTLTENLQRKLRARQKKRAWQKRRNAQLKDQKETKLKNRQQLHEQIDQWQQDQRKLLEEEKLIQQQLEFASHFLADVHRKKAACKRYLARFEKVQASMQRNQTSDNDVAELAKKWTAKLAECIREEKRLKDVLARRSMANYQRRVENEWNRTLFGDVIPKKFEHPLLAADRDRMVLVETRRDWDACLVVVGDGDGDHTAASAIPLGWVLPPKDPSPEWAQYQMKGVS